jgi:hypothetical protein
MSVILALASAENPLFSKSSMSAAAAASRKRCMRNHQITAARATVRKDKQVNIRMTAQDLVHSQKAAIEEGLPYQTLIASILNKYITGRLVERPRSTTA